MKETPDIWHRVSSEEAADCRVFKVFEDHCERDSDGKESSFFVIRAGDWSNVIAVTDSDEMVLIEQYRQGIQQIITELPGGIIDHGEDPAEAAKRELVEETGYSSNDWTHIGTSHPNPAIQDNVIHHFLATGCKRTAEPNLDDNESVVTRLVPVDEVMNMTARGEITHSMVVAAFFYYQNRQRTL